MNCFFNKRNSFFSVDVIRGGQKLLSVNIWVPGDIVLCIWSFKQHPGYYTRSTTILKVRYKRLWGVRHDNIQTYEFAQEPGGHHAQ